MAIDYLYLEAVRGASLDAVRHTILAEVAEEGWEPTESADERPAFEIEIVQRGDWLAVLDMRERLPVAWADRLAHALGVLAISARSWSDFGGVELARFDGDRLSGKVSYDLERAPVRRVSAPFLGDLAIAKNRVKLTRGVSIGADTGSDEVLERLLALARLPEPFSRYMEGMGDTILGFRESLREVPLAERPSICTRTVRFATSFHVRDVATTAVVAAIERVLATKGLRAVAESAATARQIFVRDWHGWTSFGEVVHHGKPVDWGKRLSRILGKAVLSVAVYGDVDELRVHAAGELAGRVEVSPTDPELVVDGAMLAPLGVKKKRLRATVCYNALTASGSPRAAVESVAADLGLERPVLEGRLKGRVLGFA